MNNTNDNITFTPLLHIIVDHTKGEMIDWSILDYSYISENIIIPPIPPIPPIPIDKKPLKSILRKGDIKEHNYLLR